MVNFVNDFALVGFWPLNEPSGAPRFHNYSPTRANGVVSGVSFDLNVHTTDILFREYGGRAAWPGKARCFDATSGVHYLGFQVNGLFDTNPSTTGDPFGKVLTVGQGAFDHKRLFVPPPVAQSGFTIGFWVYPKSNGMLPTSDYSNRTLAKQHSLLGQSSADYGFHMGVSGQLSSAAQFNETENALSAFFHGLNGAGSPVDPQDEITLTTPIESGRYTHITAVMRLQSSTEHHFALFKDGRLEASGSRDITTSAHQLTSAANSFREFADRVMTIGGTNDEADLFADDIYEHSTGWGHLVSGVYTFQRPLDEGEVFSLHEQGGLQPTLGTTFAECKAVTLFDSKLTAFYPFLSVGYADASKNSNPLLCETPEQETKSITTANVASPTSGPFGRGGYMQGNTSSTIGLATGSGVADELLTNRSFTILGHFSPEAGNSSFVQNLMFALGGVDSTEAQTVSHHGLGFFLGTDDDSSNKKFLMRIFENGNSAAEVAITGVAKDIWTATNSHFAFVYDDQTQGIEFYIDGISQGSGNLTLGSFVPHMERLMAGSGLPLVFGNAVAGTSTIIEDIFQSAGGQDSQLSNLAIFSRPLEQQEIYYISVSGIDITPLYYSVHDPRLMAFWSGTESVQQIIPDRAHAWRRTPGNINRSLSSYNWDTVLYNSDQLSPLLGVDYFGDPASSTLGLSSGLWSIMGGSLGNHLLSSNIYSDRRSHYGSLNFRFKPCPQERDQGKQSFNTQYVIGFEITPDGDIPPIVVPPNNAFNSMIFSNSEENDGFYGFVTSINGETNIAFTGKDFTAYTWLGSGTLVPATTSRVLIHVHALDPYVHADPANEELIFDVYVDGTKTSTYETTTSLARIWSDQIVGGTSDDWVFQIGGEGIRAAKSNAGVITNQDCGLGEISVRNFFIMNGAFTKNDINYLATSGVISSPSIPGYTNQQTATQVTLGDSNLLGYWRFSDPEADQGTASGITDLSQYGNHLVPLAKQIADQNGFISSDNSAYNLRFVPGPFANTDIGIRSSGITWAGDTPLFNSLVAPYIVSGVPFTSPDTGFSVGFWYSARVADITNNTVEAILAFGRTPTSAIDTTDVDASWIVYMDDSENIIMSLSKDGVMYLDNASNAARSSSTRTGAYSSKTLEINNTIEQHKYDGGFNNGHADAWNHVVWTYDPSELGTISCYYNGTLVDRQSMNGDALNIPTDPTARFITIFGHQEDGVWQFDGQLATEHVVLTDLFYFDKVLTETEARYIAYNGIDLATGTTTSGVIGGLIQGQDSGSGLIGGFTHGQDTASGVIGGFIPGGSIGSGSFGGYVSGVVFGDGTIGGWVRGLDDVSGILAGYMVGVDVGSGSIAGYIIGQDVGSGHFGGLIFAANNVSGIMGGFVTAADVVSGVFGGFLLGGLQGNFEFDAGFNVEVLSADDFDAQIEIAKTASSDFDAKVVIFQNEIPPLVEIIIPETSVSGLAPPFNQYFIGKASGQAGKTISSTRWTFGDLTPSVSVSQSGAGCYPVQHLYAGSGFFIAKFEAIDSDGLHASDTRIINAASGIDPVIVSLSGVPRSGNAELIVDFTTTVNILPPGVSVSTQLLNYDDGQSTIAFNPTHSYTQPGTYRPIWCVRDSRGIIWCDSLEAGNDFLESGGA